MDEASKPENSLVDDQSEAPMSILAVRNTSVRARIVGGLLIILLLLLAAAILASTTFARVDRAITVVGKETERAKSALEVGKAAADLHAALAQGTVTQDVDQFTQTVRDAEQALLSAEERLVEVAGSLPQDDPMQIALNRLDTSTTNVLILANNTRQRAEAEEWWLVESLTTGGCPSTAT